MIKIKIANGRGYFYQWDLNQLVTVSGCAHKCRVHFVQDGDPLTVDTTTHEDGSITAPVPNIMLQQPKPIICYVYVYDEPEDAERFTIKSCRFQVHERPKPVDYVYTETEVKTWEALMDAVTTDLAHINEAEAHREEAERLRQTNEGQRETAHNITMDEFERVKADANAATQQAQNAADWAITTGNEAQKVVSTLYDTCANALKGEQIGAAVKIPDLSPLQEFIDVRLTSDTLTDFSAVSVKVLGTNNLRYPYNDTSKEQDGLIFTDNGDGSVTVRGTATANTRFEMYFDSSKHPFTHLIPGVDYTLSLKADRYDAGVSLYANYITTDGKVPGWLNCTINTPRTLPYPTEGTKGRMRGYIYIKSGTDLSDPITLYPQLEVGKTATKFESFVEPSPRYPEPDGKFYYFQPVGESTTIIIDNPEVKIEAKYSRDINKAFAEMYSILQISGVAALSDPGL